MSKVERESERSKRDMADLLVLRELAEWRRLNRNAKQTGPAEKERVASAPQS